MLTIHHVNGALAGTDNEIASGKDRVIFGRQLDCDVHFPPEETAIARRHFALVRKPSGSWTVELFGEPFVAVDGTPADNGQIVRDGAKFELGKIGGPSFTVGIKQEARTDNYLRTSVQEAAPSPRMIAVRADTLARFARRFAAVALVLALGGAGFAAYNYVTTRDTTARLETAQKEFASALAREANLRIGAETRAHLARAVYHVQLQDAQKRTMGSGTAWVVGPNLLATNAHVALQREGLGRGEKMIVRAPGKDGAIHEVVDYTLHPGYVPFKAFLASDARLISLYRGREQALGGNGYDVALLRVNATLPEDARLTLATAEEIAALESGSALGTAGYPVEKMARDWAHSIGTTPELHVGVVTSITDMFNLPSDAAQRQLVHHDLPATGGQSGSPIVGPSGRVVALLNAGNVIMVQGVGRIPNAALVNFAQRADLVKDMLDGTAEAKLVEARKHWEQVALHFAEAKDKLPQAILQLSRPDDGTRPRLLAEVKRTLVAKSGKRQKTDEGEEFYMNVFASPQKLTPGFDYLFLAMAEGGNTRFDAYVDDDMAAQIVKPFYPFISCRLLTPAQQNTGDPKKPRRACATGHERADGMRIPPGETKARDVELILFNIKGIEDELASAELKYTLRIYQWVAEDVSRGPNPLRK